MVNTAAADLISAFIGGIIIGLASTLNFYMFGRITGNSGIFNTLIKFSIKDGLRWKFSFLAGIASAGFLFYLVTDNGRWTTSSFTLFFFDPIDAAIGNLHVGGWIIAGILVGIGTKMGNGGTSGHGVCGIPRLSVRSITAVGTFMGGAIGIATLRYHVEFLNSTQSFGNGFEDAWPITGGVLVALILVAFILFAGFMIFKMEEPKDRWEMPISFVVGVLFGGGLVISGMGRRTKIINFLTIHRDWDPSLMLVMCGAILVNVFTFNFIIYKVKEPVLGAKLCIPQNNKVDLRLVGGAAIFGIGWGLGGLCPGPGMVNFFLITHMIIWIPGLAIGQLGFEIVDKAIDNYRSKDKIESSYDTSSKKMNS